MPQLSNKMNAVCTVTASKFLKNIEFIMHCFAKTSRLALSRVTACESSSEKFTKIHVPASVVASVTPQNPGEVPPHPPPSPSPGRAGGSAASSCWEAVWTWISGAALGSLGQCAGPGTVSVGALAARAVVGASSATLVSRRKILKRRNQLRVSKKPRL